MAELPALIVVMGVSGAGKSTLARALGDRLRRPVVDADDLHPPANRRKMSEGVPLTDADRAPWMDAVCARLATADEPLVLAHSGLRREHRSALRTQGLSCAFFWLHGSFALLRARLADRRGHFMAPTLLRSQFDAFEATDDEGDVIPIDSTLPTPEQADACLAALAPLLRGDLP
ncbi:MAG: gluconokinase, GntK/IdnK-type [Pseudomonadota bacterium]